MATSGILLDKEKVIEAIYQKKGVIEHAAKIIPCVPSTIYNWMERDQDVKNAVADARSQSEKERIDQNEVLKQCAYISTLKLLQRNDCTMTIFILKTLCGLKEQSSSNLSQCIVRGQLPYDSGSNTTLPAQVVSEAV